MTVIPVRQQTGCMLAVPVPALAGSRAPALAKDRDVRGRARTFLCFATPGLPVIVAGKPEKVRRLCGRDTVLCHVGSDLFTQVAATAASLPGTLPPGGMMFRSPAVASLAARLERMLRSRAAASGHRDPGNCSLRRLRRLLSSTGSITEVVHPHPVYR
jgi:hypothetical protein